MKAVCLAGPDDFYPAAQQLAEEHKVQCRRYGFEPLNPIDQPFLTAKHIFNTNIELLKRADVVVANFEVFRGAEVDSGTAFEVGFAIARGIPVVWYLLSKETVAERGERYLGPLPSTNGVLRDS